MMCNILFRATDNATSNIAVSSSSQRVQVTNTTGRIQVAVANPGTATVWIAFGDSTVATTATTGLPVLGGTVRGFSADCPSGGPLYAAAIAAGATGNIYFTPGTGL